MAVTQAPLDRAHVELGVYEKALAWPGDWDSYFEAVAACGFSFVDLSVDESAERAARLQWSQAEREHVKACATRHGVAIGGVCLSIHRRIGPGSSDAATRQHALDVLHQGIDLCADLGAPLLQLAGYYAYYEDARAGARADYIATLRAGARYAALRGVMLGIENVDGEDVTSISRAKAIVDEINSAWLRLYPDIGNLTEQQCDVVPELRAGEGTMLAIHVKETRPGEPRRVAFGQGDVPWSTAFGELARQQWCGRILIEMWNEDSPDSVAVATSARNFISTRLAESGIQLIEPRR